MEDVDLVRRIGKERLVELPATATTSAERYKRGGYTMRPLRNLSVLSLSIFGRAAAPSGQALWLSSASSSLPVRRVTAR